MHSTVSSSHPCKQVAGRMQHITLDPHSPYNNPLHLQPYACHVSSIWSITYRSNAFLEYDIMRTVVRHIWQL